MPPKTKTKFPKTEKKPEKQSIPEEVALDDDWKPPSFRLGTEDLTEEEFLKKVDREKEDATKKIVDEPDVKISSDFITRKCIHLNVASLLNVASRLLLHAW